MRRASPGGARPRSSRACATTSPILREAHRYIGEQATTGYDVSPAAEWLLDNFHLIEAQLREIDDGLPRRYFRDLPVLQEEPLVGLPRVYGVAWAFVAHTDSAFDEELLVHFLKAYEEARELTLGELWALPTTLRVVLIENLRRLAERVAANKAAREVANLCADRLEAYPPAHLDAVLALLNRRSRRRDLPGADRAAPAGPAYRRRAGRARLAAPGRAAPRGDPDPAAGGPGGRQPERRQRDHLAALDRRCRLAGHRRPDQRPDAADAAVAGLRRRARRHPRSHPARDREAGKKERQERTGGRGHAARADARQRGRCRCRRRGSEERRRLLAARPRAGPAAAGAGPAPVAGSGGAKLGCAGSPCPPISARSRWRAGRSSPGCCCATAPRSPPASRPGSACSPRFLMLLPASEAAVAVINRLISESARPSHLPRLAFAAGIAAEHRPMVVDPGDPDESGRRRGARPPAAAALPRQSGARRAVRPAHRLARRRDRAAARRRRTARRGGAGDRAAQRAPSCRIRTRRPASSSCTAAAASPRPSSAGSAGSASAASSSSCSAMLATGSPSPFVDLGRVSTVGPGVRYVLTLDSDTRLPPGRLRDLVGIAAHPHNQPHLSADGRRVVRGYGILQPHVATPLCAPEDVTHYHWLFSGQSGIDPYSVASSEVYQDVFGEGTFTGKGLLDVQAVHAVLGGRLPAGQVLSHDLLEGSLARCAAVTDVSVMEDAPFHADVAASRVHRWTRGDWQLLPILLRPRRFPTRAVNRWKMLDNLRRSLVAPASLGLVVAALATDVVSPWKALALIALAFVAGPLMGTIAGIRPSRDDVARGHFYRQWLADLAAGAAERRLAAGADAAARADGDRRDRARGLAHLRQPAASSRVDHGGGGAGFGVERPADPGAQALGRGAGRGRAVGRADGAAHAASAARHAALRRLDAVAAVDLVGQPAAPAAPRRCPLGGRPRLPARRGSRHLAPVRALRRRRGPPPAARQPADRAARHGGAPHLADQHRPVPAGDDVRPRIRLDRPPRCARPAGGDPRQPADAAAPSRPLPQLVRHRAGAAAAAAVRFQRRQRQPVHAPARGRPGLPRARGAARRRFGAAPRAGPLEGADRRLAFPPRSGRAGRRARRRARRRRTPRRRLRRNDGEARRRARRAARLAARIVEQRRRGSALAPGLGDPGPARDPALGPARPRGPGRFGGPPRRGRGDLPAARPRGRLHLPLQPQAPPLPHRLSRRRARSSTPASTTCSPPRRAPPACGRSPRATCRRRTGPRSEGRSSRSATWRGCAPGRARCSST